MAMPVVFRSLAHQVHHKVYCTNEHKTESDEDSTGDAQFERYRCMEQACITQHDEAETVAILMMLEDMHGDMEGAISQGGFLSLNHIAVVTVK